MNLSPALWSVAAVQVDYDDVGNDSKDEIVCVLSGLQHVDNLSIKLETNNQLAQQVKPRNMTYSIVG